MDTGGKQEEGIGRIPSPLIMIRRNNVAIILLVLSFALLVLSLVQLHVLAVRSQHDGRAVYLSTIKQGEHFSVEWMHSVELQPWRETFKYTPEGIILTETLFKSFGAGVPSYGGREYLLEGGFIVFRGMDIKMESIPYGISSFAKHRLVFRSSTVPLYRLVEDGTFVNISVERKDLLNYLYEKVILWLRSSTSPRKY